MTHIKTVSSERPAAAQLEPILQFVGLFQSLLNTPSILLGQGQQILSVLSFATSLLGQMGAMFGFDIAQKGAI
ncbi:MAG: hypothetical protein GY851_14165 [bacterium]|nr:hypothetical protein [bacterium]